MILRYERSEVVCMVSTGEMHKKSVLHYDVCKRFSEGKTGEDIAEEFGIEPRTVWYIKKRKCHECRLK